MRGLKREAKPDWKPRMTEYSRECGEEVIYCYNTEMKILIIILVIVVLVLMWLFYLGYPLYHALQITGEIEASTTLAYEQHPLRPTMRILIAGDSTGFGTGASNPKYSTAGLLGTDFPTADITNISENNLKLAGLQAKLAGLPTDGSGHYDLILLQIGANDIVQLTRISDIASRLGAVLDLATAHGTKVIILHSGNIGLSPVFKFPISTYMTYRASEVRTIYMKEIASRPSVQYVDLFQDAAHDIFSADPAKYYARDFFHPSDAGYAVWYAGIVKALKKEGLRK
jgi:lysophospholipase L1-like esterase